MKVLVFDIGGSAIKYALMDEDANIYEKGKEKTPHDTLEHFLGILKSIYQKYQDEVEGIAMSLPGTIDCEKGMVYAPGAGLPYNENVNLVDKIHTFADVPVTLENDGKSAALAELWKGNLQDCEDGIVIVVGSGLGGGIIKDRKLWKGQHLFAGEFSYVCMGDDPNIINDAWGRKGSTNALIKQVAMRKHMEIDELDGVRIFDMIAQEDPDAIAALQCIAKNLAAGIYNLQCILDPSKILIGGGISKQPLLLKTIQEALDDIYDHIRFSIPRAKVETCRFYNDANLIGALYRFLTRENCQV